MQISEQERSRTGGMSGRKKERLSRRRQICAGRKTIMREHTFPDVTLTFNAPVVPSYHPLSGRRPFAFASTSVTVYSGVHQLSDLPKSMQESPKTKMKPDAPQSSAASSASVPLTHSAGAHLQPALPLRAGRVDDYEFFGYSFAA